MRVLLADDHTIVAQGLISLLKDEFDCVGAVADGGSLVDAARRLRPDVIVIDIGMPVLSGLEALRRLKSERNDARVIILTMHADAQLAAEAMRAGASGYVLKQAAGEELVAAIQEVLQGRTYLTPALTGDVIRQMARPATRLESRLTPRQHDVLRLIVEGRRIKEIAAALEISPRTVETHKYEMMQTLDVQSTAELVRYAIQHGLVGF